MRRNMVSGSAVRRRLVGAMMRLALTIACLGGLLFFPRPPVDAAWVNSLDDVVADDGVCTLREAITAANTNTPSGSSSGECSAGFTGHDYVSLGAGTYTLSIVGARENNNASGDLDVKERMTISGVGADRTIIDAGDIDRVMQVHLGVILILEDLTIMNGTSPRGADSIGYGASSGSPGGGIHNNNGELTLRRCKVLYNIAGSGGTGDSDYGGAGGNGGGIASEGGTLTVEDTTVAYNYSGHGGGDAGYSGDGGDGGRGGGIYTTGDTVLTRSAIHNNHTGTGGSNASSGGSSGDGGFGGGIYASETMNVLNTTVSSNVTGNGYGGTEGMGGMGGGIANAGALTLQQATVVNNVTGDGFLAGGGGGLYGFGSSVNNAQNTIIANNLLGLAVGASPTGPDCYTYNPSTLASLGYNLIENTTGCPITGDATGNLYGADPALTSLADNSGPTLTHALGLSSPAADHIAAGASGCGSVFTTDQRGQLRPAGGSCDVGAIEMQASETVAEAAGLAEGDTYVLSSVLAAITRNIGSGDPLTITVSRQEEPPIATASATDGYRRIPAQWHITAGGDSYNVDLGLCYTDDEAIGLDETTLDIYRWDAYEGVWVDRDGTLDTTNNCITATGVTTFSTWMLGAIATPVYVDVEATGDDDGSSWDDAFTDLQEALGAAVYGDEIWVAEGMYTPTDGSDRDVAFAMVPGVGVYGGFAGIETDRGERDWVTNVITLSGDIGTVGNNGDNSYHVVVAGSSVTETATLDGFVVSGGNAAYDTMDRGGGIYVTGGDPIIRNCTVASNRANYYGGGMAVDSAGGPIVANTTFMNNSAAAYGGGMANLGSSTSKVVNVRFLGNAGTYGGGGALSFQSSPTYINTIFSGNSTSVGQGGGVYNWSATAQFRNVTFSRNHASNRGGGMSNLGSSPSVINGIFWDNSAGVSSPEIYPGGLYEAVTYSIVEGAYTGTGNLNADPAFIDADGADDVAGTLDDDLTLSPGSPAIDAGSNSAVPADVADLDADEDFGEATPLDLARTPRLTDEPEPDTGEGTAPLVDIGAYEKQRTCWVRLNDDATDYTMVQDAVDASTAPDDIVKVAGMCGGVWERDGLMQTLMVTKTLTVRGGYTPTFAGPPDPVVNPTTLTAAGGGRVIVIEGSISPVIEGLRITGGDAEGQGGAGDDDGGGGVAVLTATATISNCWVFGNVGELGGGVLLGGSSALTNNEIYENVALDGGGVATGMCDPTLTGNSIHHNEADASGGGLNVYQTGGTISENTIEENDADRGGGIYVLYSDGAITGNDILSNTAGTDDGGGLYVDNSAITLSDNTIRGNVADDGSAGGVKLEGEGTDDATAADNEIAHNEANWVGAGVFINDSHPAVIDNWIHHNTGNEGSGITVQDSESLISGNTIEHNSANWRSGALAYFYSGGTLSANVIRDNDARWQAGAIRLADSDPTLANNVVIDNEVTDGGNSGILIESSMPTFLHNTIAGNTSGSGYGLYLQSGGSVVTLTNNIVATQTTGIRVEGGGSVLVDGALWYGNVDNTDGDGTITVLNETVGDPLFASDGYHLMEGSAAIDAGVVTDVTTDVDGYPRPQGSGFDIGADEYAQSYYMIFLPLVIRSAP